MTPPVVSWIELGVFLALLAGAAWLGYDYKAGKCAEAENAQLKAVEAQRDEWQRRAYESDEALRIAQQKVPQTGKQVDDEVSKHPTSPDCVVPDAVADRLQDGIDAGKSAVR